MTFKFVCVDYSKTISKVLLLNVLAQQTVRRIKNLSVVVFSTTVLIGVTINEETNRTVNMLQIATSRSLASWLFTRHRGAEFRTTEHKSI